MPINSNNLAPVIFLLELHTQCDFAKTLWGRLREAAPAWYANPDRDRFENAIPPRDIMINCTAFLSAASVISKILFEGKRGGNIARRCLRLRELLGVGELPILRHLSVRNSFEHIDERLDKIFSSFTDGQVEQICVYEHPSPNSSIILKRFDPKRLTISFTTEEISLEGCMVEISEISSRIMPAHSRLEIAKYDLWGTERASPQ